MKQEQIEESWALAAEYDRASNYILEPDMYGTYTLTRKTVENREIVYKPIAEKVTKGDSLTIIGHLDRDPIYLD